MPKIGDTLKRSTPDSFTHGSSAQRVRWFQQGFKTGNISQCNTFTLEVVSKPHLTKEKENFG
jgi:predicted metalloprotease